jgi:ParB/RepB/Spo0J family partition protein
MKEGATMQTLQAVAVADIQFSKTNPRGSMNEKKFQELLESVRKIGVMEPLIVRPMEGKNGKGGFELVCGHRRLRAAREAQLQDVPVVVRTLSDKEALEFQIIENMQREDLHPLDEADGFRALHERHGYAVEEIAAKVAKSKGYVYARLKLCALCEPARKPFLAGRLDASVALLLARLPESLQAKATKEIMQGGEWAALARPGAIGDVEDDELSNPDHREPMSYRKAVAHLQANYMLRLAGAPFDPKDPNLIRKAGACGDCPKRSGNQPELFGDVRSADVCTDPICFRAKMDASWKARAEQAEKSGLKVLTDAQAKRIFSHGEVLHNAGYQDLDERDWQHGNKTLRQLLGKHAPEPVLARNAEGEIHELVPRARVAELLKETGVTKPRGSQETNSYAREQNRKAKLAKASGRAMVAAVMAKAAGATLEKVWPVICAFVFKRAMNDTEAEVANRRGIKREKVKRSYGNALESPGEAIARWLKSQPEKERAAIERGIVIESMLTAGAPSNWSTEIAYEPLLTAGKLFGVNLKTIHAAARRAVAKRPKKSAKAKATKKNSGKKS